MAFFGRFSFVIFLFYIDIPVYLIILTASYITFTLFNPMLNTFLSTTFTPSTRGKYVGYAMSIMALVAVVFSRISGTLMDKDSSITSLILAIGGVGGCLAILIASIPFKQTYRDRTKKQPNPFTSMIAILKKDPVFLKFELYFYVYGIAFMIILPAIPLYLVDNLRLNYTEISTAKVLIPQFFIIVLAPFVGKLHDRTTPQRFSGLSFLILSSYPLILGCASFFTPSTALVFVYASYIMYGIAMIGVSFAWNISTIELAKHGSPQQYQAIHITLTGIRGLIIPPLGYLLLRLIPINYIFFISCILFVTAGILMLRVRHENHPLEN